MNAYDATIRMPGFEKRQSTEGAFSVSRLAFILIPLLFAAGCSQSEIAAKSGGEARLASAETTTSYESNHP